MLLDGVVIQYGVPREWTWLATSSIYIPHNKANQYLLMGRLQGAPDVPGATLMPTPDTSGAAPI
jgi:hypothetical protein